LCGGDDAGEGTRPETAALAGIQSPGKIQQILAQSAIPRNGLSVSGRLGIRFRPAADGLPDLDRAPGYTVAKPPEKLNLWKDEEAQKQFMFQWTTFAKRYRGIPARRLSFNLVNEPMGVSAKQYAQVMQRAIAAVRQEDPDRLILCDGLDGGLKPVEELVASGVAQCTRGYEPFRLTHYQASWVNSAGWAEPTWPLKEWHGTVDRQWLYQHRILPWKKLQDQGVGVMVGEWGAYNKTPHSVVLAWMRDCLELWKEAGWGWALWGLHGGFGILDSGRSDVAYEDFHGLKLDRKMLDLLQQF
jgi:endoglucanase